VIDRVQEGGRQRERRPFVRTPCPQQQAGADTEQDDADVLDRVEREQPLELVLEDRVDDACDRRNAADGEDKDAVPRRQLAEPLDEDADETVDGHLDHHAAHQRGHMCGRDRMCARQPRVQGHHARLRPESDDRGECDDGLEAVPVGERRRVADCVLMGEQKQGTHTPALPMVMATCGRAAGT
jgi:hypothetical protein